MDMPHLQLVPLAILLCMFANGESAPPERDLPLNVILERMMAHKLWQDGYLAEYTAVRTFYAQNDRFNLDATMVVETVFLGPEVGQSRIVKQEGSAVIRERVFDKILEAERETHSRDVRR